MSLSEDVDSKKRKGKKEKKIPLILAEYVFPIPSDAPKGGLREAERGTRWKNPSAS